MARYNSEGYRQLPGIDRGPRRQILGYSRLAQGGADQARARANQRLYESQDHLYEDGRSIREARQRAQRVSLAKKEGSFDETSEAYNEEGQAAGVEMDEAGTIRRKPKAILATSTTYTPKKPARSTPMSMARPAGQKVAETVAMTEPAGLMDMARKARRKGTLVIR